MGRVTFERKLLVKRIVRLPYGTILKGTGYVRLPDGWAFNIYQKHSSRRLVWWTYLESKRVRAERCE